MIYLEKDSINTFVLTLTESSTISNPTYLFLFQNEFNKSSQGFQWVGVDTSDYKERYNLFQFTEGTSIRPSDGVFILGQYTYTVFESADPIDVVDQDIKYYLDLNMVEEGRMVVAGVVTNTIYD
jgi:hypothetical protein